jgi:DNA polymerase-3 subunit epsilon
MNIEPTYSIVDIETTGGHRYGNRIIEIAIVNWRAGRIVEEFETLIHPERFIPISISYFTGITNEMVQDAPKFFQVAKKIIEMTTGTIFVAHNVYFDFNFIKAEFASLGYAFKRPKLCTVRLSRKIIPGYASYSLGKLCGDLGIEIKNRHRAMGDTRATVELLKLLLEKKPDLHTATDEFQEKKIMVPPNVEREEYDNLPNLPGVYYFWDRDGNPLYVGKSKDIKKRVASHFRLDVQSAKEREMKGAIYKITFEVMGSDLCAKLFECHQIKMLHPQFNRSMNRIRFLYTVIWSLDMWGYLKPEILSIKQFNPPVGSVRVTNKKNGIKRASRIYRDAFGIEPGTLRFTEQLNNFKEVLGVELFNERILDVISRQEYDQETFRIVQRGRSPEEKAYVIVEDRKISRIEYWNEDGCAQQIPLNEDQDMKQILLKHLNT